MPELDYANILRAGQQLVPDFRQQQYQDDQRRAQQQQQQLALQAAQQQQQRTLQLRDELGAAVESGDPARISRLMVKFPEFADKIKPGWEAMQTDERQRNLTQVGSAYARAQSGDYKGAAAVLRKRYDADVAAGHEDETTKELIDAFESGDPVQQRQAASVTGMVIAASDPDKFSETYKALNPTEAKPADQREYDWLVQTKGQDYADRWLAVQSDKFIPVDGVGIFKASDLLGGSTGGAPASQPKGGGQSTGASIPATGAAIEDAALTAVPGLTVTSRQRSAERNKSVGGVSNSYHLTDQARDFVPPKGMPMAALHARLKSAMPGFDVINEGDHVHVEPSPRMGRGSVRVRSKQEYDKLPSGTQYTAPDGSLRIKG